MSGDEDHAPDVTGAVHPAPEGAAWAWPTGSRVLLVVLLAAFGTVLRLGGRDADAVDRGRAGRPISLVVDPNTAPASVLEALPHVGPSLTGRILKQREIRPFSSAEDLRRRVKGVGPATLSRLLPYLHFPSEGSRLATPASRDRQLSSGPVEIARASAARAMPAP